MTISEGGKGEELCPEFSMKQNAEDLKKRIDFFKESGRPVPLILETRLVRLNSGKKLKLPSFSRKGFIKGNR